MDHFLYLPLLGLIGLAIAALENIDDQISPSLRPLLIGSAAVVLALLAWESQDYAGKFVGPEKLWSYTVEHNPMSWLAYNNLGNAYFETGRLPEAIKAYQSALQINPNMVEAHNNLGFLFYTEGQQEETAGHRDEADRDYAHAIENYQQALKFNPHFLLSLTNLANALASVGRAREAIDLYQQALLVNPNDEGARTGLAKLKTTP